MINDSRKFLLGSATESPEIALTTMRYRALKSPKQLAESVGWLLISILGRTVSDNVAFGLSALVRSIQHLGGGRAMDQ